MLFCPACLTWVQPIHWVSFMLNGQLGLHQACPCCHQEFPQREPAAV